MAEMDEPFNPVTLFPEILKAHPKKAKYIFYDPNTFAQLTTDKVNKHMQRIMPEFVDWVFETKGIKIRLESHERWSSHTWRGSAIGCAFSRRIQVQLICEASRHQGDSVYSYIRMQRQKNLKAFSKKWGTAWGKMPPHYLAKLEYELATRDKLVRINAPF
jgi:hypothetical protein